MSQGQDFITFFLIQPEVGPPTQTGGMAQQAQPSVPSSAPSGAPGGGKQSGLQQVTQCQVSDSPQSESFCLFFIVHEFLFLVALWPVRTYSDIWEGKRQLCMEHQFWWCFENSSLYLKRVNLGPCLSCLVGIVGYIGNAYVYREKFGWIERSWTYRLKVQDPMLGLVRSITQSRATSRRWMPKVPAD